ncbi:MAG: hypothetical protein HQL83_05155 [Magnetococcales bacterium]|nr:hypothetical protein [Magnetococcales bacterium]MBF0347353.1 hypothetical protein [Magnetococcales bacterium]MBF0631619.1 hypothetical protein [Magnetococcales bacterium]
MKFRNKIPTIRMVLACSTLAAATWIMAPLPDALGTGYWTHPENSSGRMQRIQELNGALESLSAAHIQQQIAIQQGQQALSNLETQLTAARKALTVEERPVTEVLNQYRKAQELSLIDPMVSTESQRLAVVKAKEANNAVISKRKGEIETLEGKIPMIRSDIEKGRQQLNVILQQIDAVIKQRDEVSEHVFLKNVAN